MPLDETEPKFSEQIALGGALVPLPFPIDAVRVEREESVSGAGHRRGVRRAPGGGATMMP